MKILAALSINVTFIAINICLYVTSKIDIYLLAAGIGIGLTLAVVGVNIMKGENKK